MLDTQAGAVSLRNMAAEDLAQASSLVCDNYRYLARTEGYDARRLNDLIQLRGSTEALLRQMKQCAFIVAQRQGAIAGLASVQRNEIDKLFVAPAVHRAGIGRILFREACRRIQADGYDSVFLGAVPGAVPFYAKMGMRITGYKLIDKGPLEGFTQPLMALDFADEKSSFCG